MLVNRQTTLSGRERCSLFYFEDRPLTGMRIILRKLLPGKMSEQFSSTDFQTDETNFDKEWRWNIVSDEMEKIVEILYTVSNERFTKAGPMIWKVLRPRIILRNETLKTRYIDYSLKRLRPRYLQRKAQEYLLENPNATRNDFSLEISR